MWHEPPNHRLWRGSSRPNPKPKNSLSIDIFCQYTYPYLLIYGLGQKHAKNQCQCSRTECLLIVFQFFKFLIHTQELSKFIRSYCFKWHKNHKPLLRFISDKVAQLEVTREPNLHIIKHKKGPVKPIYKLVESRSVNVRGNPKQLQPYTNNFLRMINSCKSKMYLCMHPRQLHNRA